MDRSDLILGVSRVVGAVTVVVGGVVGAQSWADARYVLKYEMQELRADIAALHRARIEDELFRLEATPENKRSDVDRAVIERYRRQLHPI